MRSRLIGISERMLTSALSELEKDGLIRRIVYPQVPSKVKYEVFTTLCLPQTRQTKKKLLQKSSEIRIFIYSTSNDRIMNLLSILENFSTTTWIFFSVFSNILLFLFSVSLYIFIDRTCSKNKLQPEDHPINRPNIYLSIFTVILNSALMLFAVYLWKQGYMTLHHKNSLGTILLETLLIVFIMDFLMYVFHYIAHIPAIYAIIHQKHHDHSSTNYLSLFVLHPLETIGFGLMMIVVFTSRDFSVYSLSLYITINLIWGTIGHLNREFFPKWAKYFSLGTTNFHYQHHLHERYNFGFYTTIWDRLFGTHKKQL